MRRWTSTPYSQVYITINAMHKKQQFNLACGEPIGDLSLCQSLIMFISDKNGRN